jgi:hypothetical protein
LAMPPRTAGLHPDFPVARLLQASAWTSSRPMKRDRKRAIFSSAPELCDTSCLLAATPSSAGNKVGFAAEASGRDPRWSSPKSSRNRAFSARSARSSASASSSRARPSLSCERPVTLALFPLYGGVPTAPRLRRGDPGVWYAPGLCRSGSRDGCSTQKAGSTWAKARQRAESP